MISTVSLLVSLVLAAPQLHLAPADGPIHVAPADGPSLPSLAPLGGGATFVTQTRPRLGVSSATTTTTSRHHDFISTVNGSGDHLIAATTTTISVPIATLVTTRISRTTYVSSVEYTSSTYVDPIATTTDAYYTTTTTCSETETPTPAAYTTAGYYAPSPAAEQVYSGSAETGMSIFVLIAVVFAL